jgi:type IV pilus assembly protein PilW
MSRLAASRTARRRSVRGLTLTELMIGLAAGLIVTLVGTSTFLLARQGFGTNVDQSTNLDAGRLGLDLLARNVRMAGAPPFDPATFTADTAFGLPSGAVALEGEEGGDAPDKVTVRYWSNLPYDAARMVGADCLGQAVGVGVVVNAFSVSKTDGLLCKGNGSGASDEALPVAAQVVDLQLRYGVAPTPEAGSATRFVNADTVTTDGAWNRVRSVDLCIEVVAPEKRGGSGATPGLNCRGAAFPSDNQLRRVYRTTVNVRNGTTGNIFPDNAMP